MSQAGDSEHDDALLEALSDETHHEYFAERVASWPPIVQHSPLTDIVPGEPLQLIVYKNITYKIILDRDAQKEHISKRSMYLYVVIYIYMYVMVR